ncbi:MAG: succinylglutamate desuccinylase/aspartoacylase family protein [Candidatus Jorgensenbacteria bacterium]|nr:succinylglutamate desuccinylase/aspartoacylase family protein [Candidatus Jorgensenbacteria bacterium]
MKKTFPREITIIYGLKNKAYHIKLLEARGKSAGPTVWLVAGIHGEEVGGVATAREIMKQLSRKGLERGAVYAIPGANPTAISVKARSIPESNEDLNRSFPGKKNGSLGKRIAEQIFSIITETKPNIVLDLHNDWIASIPYTLIDPYPGLRRRKAFLAAEKIANETGFVVVHEEEETEGASWRKTLSGSLLSRGIPAITLELGGAFTVNKTNVKAGVAAIWNVLASLKMVNPRDTKPLFQTPPLFAGATLTYSGEPKIKTKGTVRFLACPGDIVKPKQIIAEVIDAKRKIRETVKAKYTGVVLGNADTTSAYPGFEAFAFAAVKK